ncbi:MAG: hypothetical protein IKZ82_02250 [Clostridia bacterium]|nr:hypothetical protein [Clostridia bacterium]
MKKHFAFIIAALAFCLLITACKEHGKPKDENASPAPITLEESLKTESDLEMFILTDAANADLSELQEVYGVAGQRRYVPKRYGIADNATAPQPLPEQFVLYIVSPWPDYEDGGSFVTNIQITDPKVRVFGLTIESSSEEFIEKCSMLGYNRVYSIDNEEYDGFSYYDEYTCMKSADGKNYIALAKKDSNTYIVLFAPVTNRGGIIF